MYTYCLHEKLNFCINFTYVLEQTKQMLTAMTALYFRHCTIMTAKCILLKGGKIHLMPVQVYCVLQPTTTDTIFKPEVWQFTKQCSEVTTIKPANGDSCISKQFLVCRRCHCQHSRAMYLYWNYAYNQH